MGFYDNPVHGWPGLGSSIFYRYQKGLRAIVEAVGDGTFHQFRSDWILVAQAMIDRGIPSSVHFAHSMGGKTLTDFSEYMKPHGHQCYLFCLDRTLEGPPFVLCKPMGSNVPEAVDVHAGLRTLEHGPDFTGNHLVINKLADSHVGVTLDPDVQKIAIAFGKKWKNQ